MFYCWFKQTFQFLDFC